MMKMVLVVATCQSTAQVTGAHLSVLSLCQISSIEDERPRRLVHCGVLPPSGVGHVVPIIFTLPAHPYRQVGTSHFGPTCHYLTDPSRRAEPGGGV
jgi:hypothetical protein